MIWTDQISIKYLSYSNILQGLSHQEEDKYSQSNKRDHYNQPINQTQLHLFKKINFYYTLLQCS